MRERDIASRLDAVQRELGEQRRLLEGLARRLAPELLDPTLPASASTADGARFLQGTGWIGTETHEGPAEEPVAGELGLSACRAARAAVRAAERLQAAGLSVVELEPDERWSR
jgi:hypothetical protein